ncbi:MAG: hypothetical protein OXI96_05090 [Acidimicrobiaceae bacterium]|nr:hypothetical protein [Acidimicrobiaceae bacterium]
MANYSHLAKAGRFLAAIFIGGSFVFWVWAFTPWARYENPARLDDHAFAVWANELCIQTHSVINALPSPRQADSFKQRATHISQGSNEIDSLITNLRAKANNLSTTTSGDGPADVELINSWLSDWDVYLSDRRAHEAKLRTADSNTPDRELWFLMSDIMPGGVYSERMNGFARLNNMDACQTPGDL